jgi:hypothetical protein
MGIGALKPVFFLFTEMVGGRPVQARHLLPGFLCLVCPRLKGVGADEEEGWNNQAVDLTVTF